MKDVQDSLLNIKHLSELYPNSGSITKLLGELYKKTLQPEAIKNNPEVLVSLVTDLAYHNPRAYPIASAIISKTLSCVQDDDLKKTLVNKIKKRFSKIPNTEHMDLWLQRITLKPFQDITYEGRLCKLAAGEKDITIWNCDWLNDSLSQTISSANLIDINKIETLDAVIQPEEVSLFKQTGYY